ncbi:GpE family phage tail protein [Shewanella sp. ZOR0012]|jgi:hypothetical protein|nr:GpE family phage tail protein [Shewanella sp. DC2-4]NRD34589.1 GpE family phage tail protein [Shewanella sp. DC2-4]NSM26788.1 GpE family phage tail protein [Shewanella sp. ZOR0012]|tara:strand:+ start:38854 stop:38982 length:129 start_codon:yes stop_codon:yes gene_type:complete
MELEADLFLTFQGWGPADTAPMYLDELIHWHRIASERRESDD